MSFEIAPPNISNTPRAINIPWGESSIDNFKLSFGGLGSGVNGDWVIGLFPAKDNYNLATIIKTCKSLETIRPT
jgi:hypothetical protein